MDVFTLRPDNSYIPDKMVEGCYSKIWTERFSAPGEFELTTYDIRNTMALLPEMTFISHRHTTEVMMVEDRTIQYDDNDIPTLKVTGRSLSAFMENRVVEAMYQKRRTLAKKYSTSGAPAVLLYNAFNNNSGKDVTRDDDYNYSDLDKLPNVVISDSVVSPGSAQNWWVEGGPLDTQVWDILTKNDLGLRVIRPKLGVSANIVTVASLPLTDRGKVTRTVTPDITALRFDIYSGTDRSASQSTNERVIFFQARGDIDNANYLFSVKNYRTFSELLSSIGLPPAYRSGEGSFSGFNRRVTTWDAGLPEIPDPPEKPEAPDPPKSGASDSEKTQYQHDLDNYRADLDIWRPKYNAWDTKRNNIIVDFFDDSADAALKDLKKKRRMSVLTGTASPDSPFKYNVDYQLGDYVTLNGAYGQTERMMVSEYVLSEDNTGETGNPGLSLP